MVQPASKRLVTEAAVAGHVTANLPARLSEATLDATYVPLGHFDYSTPSAPMMEFATNAGSGRILHLLSGAGSTSEIAGIGVDNPGSQGFTFSLKSTGNIGIGVNLETTSGADSVGYLGAVLAQGTGLEMRKGSQNGGTLVNLRADYGGTGTLFRWGQGAGDTKGQIKEDGALWVQSAATNQNAIRTGTAGSNIGIKLYHWTGAANLWFSSQITTQGQSLLLQSGAGAANMGGETMNTLIELNNGNSVGFFGAAPVTKPAAVPVTAAGVHAALVSLGLIGA